MPLVQLQLLDTVNQKVLAKFVLVDIALQNLHKVARSRHGLLDPGCHVGEHVTTCHSQPLQVWDHFKQSIQMLLLYNCPPEAYVGQPQLATA